MPSANLLKPSILNWTLPALSKALNLKFSRFSQNFIDRASSKDSIVFFKSACTFLFWFVKVFCSSSNTSFSGTSTFNKREVFSYLTSAFSRMFIASSNSAIYFSVLAVLLVPAILLFKLFIAFSLLLLSSIASKVSRIKVKGLLLVIFFPEAVTQSPSSSILYVTPSTITTPVSALNTSLYASDILLSLAKYKPQPCTWSPTPAPILPMSKRSKL